MESQQALGLTKWQNTTLVQIRGQHTATAQQPANNAMVQALAVHPRGIQQQALRLVERQA